VKVLNKAHIITARRIALIMNSSYLQTLSVKKKGRNAHIKKEKGEEKKRKNNVRSFS
jgi:hypothetical protein